MRGGLRGGDLAELLLVVGDALCEHLNQVLRVPGTYRDDRLRPRLVRAGDLVQEEERELVLLVGDLDPVGVDRVEVAGDVDRYLSVSHTLLL